MPDTFTRRTALAASVTLPLLPVEALATPADLAVEAYREWRAAYDVHNAFLEAEVKDSSPEGQVIFDREWAARLALSDAVATTPAGLICQVMPTVTLLTHGRECRPRVPLKSAISVLGKHLPG